MNKTPKPKPCKVCGTLTTNRPMLCGFDCSMALHKEKQAEKKQKGHHKVSIDDYKTKVVKKTKTLSSELALTQDVFNKLRRLQEFDWFLSRNIEPYCISCGLTKMDWCCGHLRTVGSSGQLRFDPKNTFLQCNRYCNMGLSGNVTGYKEGLLKRFDDGQAIIDYCETNNDLAQWGIDELKAMRIKFNRKIRELESIGFITDYIEQNKEVVFSKRKRAR